MPVRIRKFIIPVLVLGAGIAVGRIYNKQFSPHPHLGNFIMPQGIATLSSGTGRSGSPDEKGKDSKANALRPPSGEKLNRYAKNLYQTVGDDRRLTWGIRDLAGLSEDAVSSIQGKIDSAYAKFDEAAKQKLSYSEAESDPSKGRFVYDLEPFPEAADGIWKNLQEEMKSVAGSQASELLISAFHEDQRFGFMGKYRYKFVYDKTENVLHVEGFDPGTGKLKDSGGCEFGKMPSWLKGVLPSH